VAAQGGGMGGFRPRRSPDHLPTDRGFTLTERPVQMFPYHRASRSREASISNRGHAHGTAAFTALMIERRVLETQAGRRARAGRNHDLPPTSHAPSSFHPDRGGTAAFEALVKAHVYLVARTSPRRSMSLDLAGLCHGIEMSPVQ
jgi:hypothetical protein